MSGQVRHTEGNFLGWQNLKLYYQGWLPKTEPKAILVVVHGLAEHSGRYQPLAERFVPLNYGVFALDHRGHGKSEGLPGYVTRFQDYLIDLETFFRLVRGKYGTAQIFLLGHSLGGTIATAYAIRHQRELAGLVLSGATLKVGDSVSPIMMVLARVLSRLMPKVGLDTIDADAISRDQAVVTAYRDDPLVYRGKIRARLGGELLNAMPEIQAQMSKIKLPVLVMHGSADRLSNPAGSQMIYQGIGSRDRTLKLYQSCYHEIFNEPEREVVMSDLENWLDAHL